MAPGVVRAGDDHSRVAQRRTGQWPSIDRRSDRFQQIRGARSPIYTEYNVGHFSRAFTLSSKIDQQQISAQLEDGVLTLTLKKSRDAMPRKITIGSWTTRGLLQQQPPL